MAPKIPIKAFKNKEKLIEKPIIKSKKHKKKNYQSFSIYIFKLFRTLDKVGNLGISRRSMFILNNFVYDMLERIASEAGRVTVYGKKNTMGSREVRTAIRLLLPGELAKHADQEGLKAITKYHRSVAQAKPAAIA